MKVDKKANKQSLRESKEIPAMSFDDALRKILKAPPQPRVAKKRRKASQKSKSI
jgi:hypothetical protein